MLAADPEVVAAAVLPKMLVFELTPDPEILKILGPEAEPVVPWKSDVEDVLLGVVPNKLVFAAPKIFVVFLLASPVWAPANIFVLESDLVKSMLKILPGLEVPPPNMLGVLLPLPDVSFGWVEVTNILPDDAVPNMFDLVFGANILAVITRDSFAAPSPPKRLPP